MGLVSGYLYKIASLEKSLMDKILQVDELLKKESQLEELEGRVKGAIIKLNELNDFIDSYGIYVREVKKSQVNEIKQILEGK